MNGERRITRKAGRREGGEPPPFFGRQKPLENRDRPLVVGFGERANYARDKARARSYLAARGPAPPRPPNCAPRHSAERAPAEHPQLGLRRDLSAQCGNELGLESPLHFFTKDLRSVPWPHGRSMTISGRRSTCYNKSPFALGSILSPRMRALARGSRHCRHQCKKAVRGGAYKERHLQGSDCTRASLSIEARTRGDAFHNTARTRARRAGSGVLRNARRPSRTTACRPPSEHDARKHRLVSPRCQALGGFATTPISFGQASRIGVHSFGQELAAPGCITSSSHIRSRRHELGNELTRQTARCERPVHREGTLQHHVPQISAPQKRATTSAAWASCSRAARRPPRTPSSRRPHFVPRGRSARSSASSTATRTCRTTTRSRTGCCPTSTTASSPSATSAACATRAAS